MTDGRKAFHRREGDVFVPTGLGLSPWDKTSQSGVSLAGLVAHVLENVPSRTPMLIARITLDIMGTVPMEPLTPVIRLLRDGPRMQLVEAAFEAGGRTWVRATALRVRLGDSPVSTQPLTHAFPGEALVTHSTPWFDVIRINGDYEVPGTGAMWVRVTADAVEGVPLSPLQRLSIVSDFGAGTAPVVSHKHWTSANMDISMHMSRLAVGDWLLIDSNSESAGNGIGVSTARIGDAEGMFATTLQTTFLEKR